MSEAPTRKSKPVATQQSGASLLEQTAEIASERLNMLLVGLFSALDDLFL